MNQIGEIISQNGFKVNTNCVPPDHIKNILNQASANRPIIVNIAWQSRGGHQIVSVGKSKSLYLFLDPVFGLVEEDAAMLPPIRSPSRANKYSRCPRYVFWLVHATTVIQ